MSTDGLSGFEVNTKLKKIKRKLDVYEDRSKHNIRRGASSTHKKQKLEKYEDRLNEYRNSDTKDHKRGIDVEDESEFVDRVVSHLKRKNISYSLEVNVINEGTIGGPNADIILDEFNIAIECKKDNSRRSLMKAIGQCKFYSYYGYEPLILTPRWSVPRNYSDRINTVADSNIAFGCLCESPVEIKPLCNFHLLDVYFI